MASLCGNVYCTLQTCIHEVFQMLCMHVYGISMKVPLHDRCHASLVQAASMDIQLKPEGSPQLQKSDPTAAHTTVYPRMVVDRIVCHLAGCQHVHGAEAGGRRQNTQGDVLGHGPHQQQAGVLGRAFALQFKRL